MSNERVKAKKSFLSRNIDMTEGVVWRQLLLFALPLIIGDFLQQLYSTTDSIIVGQFVGKEALAAVTSTETLINAIIGMFSGISAGATIVIARYFGEKNNKKLSDGVHTTMTIALIMGVIMTLVGVFLSPAMLRLLSTPEDVFPEARTYLTIYFCGMMGLVVYNMAGGILRAVGDSRRPLVALVITAAINIVLDLLFVCVFHMGVAGAALATIIGIYISSFYLLGVLMKTEEAFRFVPKKIRINKDIAGSVFRIGIPTGLNKSIVAFSNLMVISHINYFGSGATAGWGVYRRVDTLVMNIMTNMSTAISTFVSQNIGGKKTERVNSGCRFGLLATFAVTIVLDALLFVFREPIIRLFNADAEVIYYGSIAFAMQLPFQPLNAFAHAQGGKLRGYGDSAGPAYISLLCMVVLRQIYLNVGWNYIRSFEFVVSCYPFAWIMNVLILAIYSAVKGYGVFRPARGRAAQGTKL